MKILSKMLSKKDEPGQSGASDMELDGEDRSLAPQGDDTGGFNPTASTPLPPNADPGHPVTARDEEPEVAGSGWGDGAWAEDDWDEDEDWGEEDADPGATGLSADKKALVSEIRDAMVSMNAMRPATQAPAPAEDPAQERQALARGEFGRPGDEDRILEKTDQAMTEEGSSRRRFAMAHLKAAAQATKADRVLRHVVSRDPSADPEEQSPYRDDLAKAVRPHSTSRPISRVVGRVQTRSPIWDQGEGDEDAALYAAAGDGSDENVSDRVGAELDAVENQRFARDPMDLSAEDFADEGPGETARVESAFPASPFAREAVASTPVNAFDDLGAEDFADEAADFDDPHRFEVAFDGDEADGPQPSRVVSAAVAFANAPDEEEDPTPPEGEVRKAIWEAAEEVAAEVEASQPAAAEDLTMAGALPEEEPVEEASEEDQALDIASELAAAKAAAGARRISETPPAPPATPAAEAPPVTPTRPAAPAVEATAEAENFSDVSANVPGRAGRNAGRVKTRLLGFQGHEEKDVFETAQGAAAPAVQFPAGWIVVVAGPGRGTCFTLQMGVSQIGRGEDQSVRLDFGDTSISRNNHAAVAYDEEQGKFYLGHGGKSNLVRLNGMPVLSTEELNSGDEIRIGETTLKFVALCGADFVWGDIGETAAE